ncbi:MAG: T9SS type A sorting domain-containing protein [Chitinophagaceae bacterium]|nr:T9SS type A sorting domain-containing protein [Chitinophagaceae bacterium]
MKKRTVGIVLALAAMAGSIIYYPNFNSPNRSHGIVNELIEEEDEEKREPEQLSFFVEQRWKRDLELLRDPQTGRIPEYIRDQELKQARTIPQKESLVSGPQNLNTYSEAGPDNIGGRTRAVAFDRRYNGTTNRIILSGSVSGGIFRTTDGGTSWTRVSPTDDIHNLTALAQDPRAGQQDTWYAGGGEFIGNSASGLDGASAYLGFGIWKSVNNGLTWTKLTRVVTDINGTTIIGGGALEAFDHPFDIVHKIEVNSTNGHVYVGGHRRLVRSIDGGITWNVVFTGTQPATSATGQMDIVTRTTDGRLYLGVNGGFPDPDKRGVWTSTNGTTWTRMAGGPTINVDSVANWRGNASDGNSRRIIMALAPSNQNTLFITYENGLDHSSPSNKPEVDLYRYDAGGNTWTNLSANVPDFPGQMDGVDPFLTQGGYNLMIAVKPNDPNTVFLGGVNLFRSTSGFTNTTSTAWIGGYGPTSLTTGLNVYGSQNNPDDILKWSHPDMHALAFDPSNPNRAISANDGGLQVSDNILANIAGPEPVSWNVLTDYQTLQYYHVAMDPGSGRNNFVGGAQDNGTRFRDATGVLGSPTGNSHFRLLSGDGAASGIASVTGTTQNVFGSTQQGNIIRATMSPGSVTGGTIRPNGLTANPDGGFGDFVTYFKIDFDNTNDLYYVNFNRLFRTTASNTVTSSTWTELTGIRTAVNPGNPTAGTNISISTLELSRGAYVASHALFIGTSNGKIFRLDDPRNAAATKAPVNITPTGLTGYISDIAVNPNNDEEVMAVVSNYGVASIWWTQNAKSATPVWIRAEGNLSLPSIRSCAIVVKKDGANASAVEYYVGTSVGLYSAVNIQTLPAVGGTISPAWVREGGAVLNFALVTSLDYRPQDNVLLVGTHGNGMYFASTGTPDYRPNQTTGLPDPVRNDKKFIRTAYPTMTRNDVSYQIGDMFTVKRLIVRVHSISGQEVYRKETGYVNGTVDVRKLGAGTYILSITSDDYKQQFVRQFVKE